MQHVFIVGAKSMGAYGGYETFVDQLTRQHQHNQKIQYHVACKANGEGSMEQAGLQGDKSLGCREFFLHRAHCFAIPVPKIGAASAIYYDVAALHWCCRYIERNRIPNPIVYILACRIGPFIGYFQRKIHKLGGKLYLNPDGHEWMRAKWSAPVRQYWKISERMMVRHSDRIICDSVHIEQYIHKRYDRKGKRGADPRTEFIAYGADLAKSCLQDGDPTFCKWLADKGLAVREYYLVVGRFVPENNYETMIREFMRSGTERRLAILSNAGGRLLEELERKLHFSQDERICFVGTVYDQELLKKIRENAYAYLHGHQVGGTNPSLLEAMSSTGLNLLLDVCFNREVAKDGALYWTKEPGSLQRVLETAEQMDAKERAAYQKRARDIIAQSYSWQKIAQQYERAFLQEAGLDADTR